MINSDTIILIIVCAIVGASIFQAGRMHGEAGILKSLKNINNSSPTLAAVEQLAQSFPGDAIELLLNKIVDGYIALRPTIPDSTLRQVEDTGAEIAFKVANKSTLPGDDPAFLLRLNDIPLVPIVPPTAPPTAPPTGSVTG